MLPLQFALELETALNNQITLLSANTGPLPAMALINKFQENFYALLTVASATDVNIDKYPVVETTGLLGSDSDWQQFTHRDKPATDSVNLPALTALWSVYTLFDRSAQYYQQAAANSAHPATRLFFHSLAETKKMMRRRLAGIIQSLLNHYWGQLGFAPFMLGKEG
ncbi:hypothetical protein [Sporomusa termitida]|uniref:Uncharacterized protein n=1 Tax=Sporomusa termitida TaxID=2377 RepID=A0A517DTI3_9FIRM|nr:hypothetical protein [Sporomusa termitida]QDR80651.1 hypothetical protein SPTER_19810 [Sporomusa termitida]